MDDVLAAMVRGEERQNTRERAAPGHGLAPKNTLWTLRLHQDSAPGWPENNDL